MSERHFWASIPRSSSPAYAPRPTIGARGVDTLPRVGYNSCAMWPDTLTAREKSRTERAIKALRDVPWAARLVREAAPLLQPMSQLARSQAKMGALLETRFAHELHRTGHSAEHEYETGVGGSTVDFRVVGTREWLIEIVSVRASDAMRRATRTDGVFSEVLLTTHAEDPAQSEESELIRVQEKIGDKVLGSQGRPTKFPQPDKALHVILTDVRGLLCSDVDDYGEIAYGADALAPDRKWMGHYWNGAPVRGLFDRANPLRASELVRERIHFLGFVHEQDYVEGEIADRASYFHNPHLFPSSDEVRCALEAYPLQRRRGRPS